VVKPQQTEQILQDARAVVLRVRERHDFDYQELDIEEDETLLRAYLERIPVLTIDGAEAFELFVDEVELERCLSDLQRSTGP